MSHKIAVRSSACNPNGCRGFLNHNVPNEALLVTRQVLPSKLPTVKGLKSETQRVR
jgi:hypothetical protein